MSIGRGLGALLTPTGSRKKIAYSAKTEMATDKIWVVPFSDIAVRADQPRKNFNEAELNELAASIKAHGILQPLLVSEKENGGYELIAGERRFRAAKLAGQATVPVIVKKMADQEKLEVALIENIQRANLNPVEEAFAYKRLIEEFGLTQEQVAEKVGKSRPAIGNAVRLLELPEEVQSALATNKISAGQARALLGMPDRKQQLNMLYSMLGQKITVRELEREASKQRPVLLNRRDPNLLYLEEQLRSALGAKAVINKKGERGTVVIDFYSSEELNRLIKKITSI